MTDNRYSRWSRVGLSLFVLMLSGNAWGQTPFKVVTLGDSITKGVRPGVKAEETFAAQLQTALRKEGVAAEVVNVGIGGEDTAGALKRLAKDVVSQKPRLVTVMYGTNDSYVDKGKKDSRLTVEEYRANLRKIVDQLRRAGIKAVLMTEPRFGDKHGLNGAGEHPNKRLQVYVQACREVAEETKVPLVDHFAHWTERNTAGTDIGAWTTDQCHPNPQGHLQMTRTMLPVLRKVLVKKGPVAGSNTVKSKPDVVIYDGTYPGWPWVTAGADGTLYCVFREGTVHDYSATGRIMLSVSSDRGKTWSKARVIVDVPEVDDRNVAIVELRKGDLLVSYNTYSKARESLAMMVRSTDGGRTWSKPQPIGEPNTRTKAAAITLANGTLLLPYYIAPGNGSLAARSNDNGATWKTVRVPDVEGFVGDEWDVLEVEPGRLIGIVRNSHPKTDGFFWKTESRDSGTTWSMPKRTNVQSQRHASPAQITRHGQTPTLIYADRRMVSVSAVKTADPDFLLWDLERRLPCYRYNADESPIPDGSYPVSVPVSPRQRLIVDYEIREDSKRIVGYLVTFPERW